jgi:hypothetical protein
MLFWCAWMGCTFWQVPEGLAALCLLHTYQGRHRGMHHESYMCILGWAALGERRKAMQPKVSGRHAAPVTECTGGTQGSPGWPQ